MDGHASRLSAGGGPKEARRRRPVSAPHFRDIGDEEQRYVFCSHHERHIRSHCGTNVGYLVVSRARCKGDESCGGVDQPFVFHLSLVAYWLQTCATAVNGFMPA
jgi:hypothetical protein